MYSFLKIAGASAVASVMVMGSVLAHGSDTEANANGRVALWWGSHRSSSSSVSSVSSSSTTSTSSVSSTSSTVSSISSSRSGNSSAANVALCMQAAIEKRDAAIIAGVDAFHASVKTALQTRKDALKAAWSKPTAKERKAAENAAWDAYKGSWKNASKTLNSVRKNVWKTFKAEAKACGGKTDYKLGEKIDGRFEFHF